MPPGIAAAPLTATMHPQLFPASDLSPLEEARAILDEAVALWQPFGLYVGLTGGDDSLAAAAVTSSHPLFRGCFHIRTGTGIPEATEHVRHVCAQTGWPLHVLHADPHFYAQWVLEHGFPGPAMHNTMYQRLKERPLRAFLRQQKHGRPRTALMGVVTGCRKGESARRMGTVQTIQRDRYRSLLWVAPLIHWSAEGTRRLIAGHALPRSPVKKAIGMSGECLCGAFARPGELQIIAAHYPEVADRITELEAKARNRGVHCVWDEAPPKSAGPRSRSQGATLDLNLCSGCELRRQR